MAWKRILVTLIGYSRTWWISQESNVFSMVKTNQHKKKLCPYFCVFYIRCAEKLSLQIPFLWEIGQLRLEDRSKFSIGDGIGEESSMDSIISSWVIARDGEGMVVWLLLSMIDLKGLSIMCFLFEQIVGGWVVWKESVFLEKLYEMWRCVLFLKKN